MFEKTSYKVAWTNSKSRSEERRTFDEWEPALAFYDDVAADPHTVAARLVEITEREVRCVEHELKRA